WRPGKVGRWVVRRKGGLAFDPDRALPVEAGEGPERFRLAERPSSLPERPIHATGKPRAGSPRMRLLFLSLLAAVLTPGLAARGAPADRAALARKVDLDFDREPFRPALDRLLSGSGLTAEVDQAFPNVPVTLSAHVVRLETALRLLARTSAGLSLELNGRR